MTVRRLIVLSLLLFVTTMSGAQMQPGTLTGTVVTVSNGQTTPLRGATITLIRPGAAPQVHVSDAQGEYRFVNLTPGTYQTKAQLAGYADAGAPADIYAGKNTTQTLTLRPTAVSTEKKKE